MSLVISEAAAKTEKQYKDGLAYFKRMGYLDKWPMYERFKAGDQWPPITERTKHLPRPVFNIIRFIENHKVAAVMNENIKMVFSTTETQDDDPIFDEAADKFTRFSDTTWEMIKQDELNEEVLESAANIGTGAVHYYMDMSKKGGNTLKYVGELCGEVIDPVNLFFGNPQQPDVQKQPYIIISSREEVKKVREIAKKNGISKEIAETYINPDDFTRNEGYDMAQVEMTDDQKVTVLTKYWKERGENGEMTVHFHQVSCGIEIRKKTDTKLHQYPIAVMVWEKRKKSIYGVGDTEGLIPNQKAINFLMAMQVLSVQLTGWPKMVYKKQAINPSKVTNAPGEMIEDHSPPGTDGVKYLTPGSSTNQAQVLVEKFIEYTRELSGANEAATGTAPSADLNATAIMLLQKAAGVPIESIKRRFYRFIEDIGRIWEDFWKVKYNLPRVVRMKNDEGEEISEIVDFSRYRDIELNLKIDVGPSSTYSESLMMSSLENLFKNGFITFEQYLKYAPKNVIPFKDRLIKDIEKQKEMNAQNGIVNDILNVMTPQEQAMFQQLPSQQQEMMLQEMIGRNQPTQPIGGVTFG